MNKSSFTIPVISTGIGSGEPQTTDERFTFHNFYHYKGEAVFVFTNENNGVELFVTHDGNIVKQPDHWDLAKRTLYSMKIKLAVLEVMLSVSTRIDGVLVCQLGGVTVIANQQPIKSKGAISEMVNAWQPVVDLFDGIIRRRPEAGCGILDNGSYLGGYYFLIQLQEQRSALLYACSATDLIPACREIVCFGSHHTNVDPTDHLRAHQTMVDVLVEQLGFMLNGGFSGIVVDHNGVTWECHQSLDTTVRYITFVRDRAMDIPELGCYSATTSHIVSVPSMCTTDLSLMISKLAY